MGAVWGPRLALSRVSHSALSPEGLNGYSGIDVVLNVLGWTLSCSWVGLVPGEGSAMSGVKALYCMF